MFSFLRPGAVAKEPIVGGWASGKWGHRGHTHNQGSENRLKIGWKSLLPFLPPLPTHKKVQNQPKLLFSIEFYLFHFNFKIPNFDQIFSIFSHCSATDDP